MTIQQDSIDFIIGLIIADLYSSVILDGVRKGTIGQPIVPNSQFGYFRAHSTQGSLSLSLYSGDALLSRAELSRFWEVEELPHQSTLSPDEKYCEEHFISTHSRDPKGQYIVLQEGSPIEIEDSRATAARMLTTLNRRLKRTRFKKRLRLISNGL